MAKYKGRYRVETTRLPGWDYASAGCYFVTLCTKERIPFFGTVTDGKMTLSPLGDIVAHEWQRTERVRDNVTLGAWVVMPNHVHGIIVIHERDTAETGRVISTSKSRLVPGSLGAIMGQIKSICTKRIWATGCTDFGWQPRFYDRIIPDEETLRRARQYIVDNPSRWSHDHNNPANLYM